LLCEENTLDPITEQPFSPQGAEGATSCENDFYLMDQGNPAERRILVPDEGPDQTVLRVRALGFEKIIRVEVVR
jgi:hypothetical protein